MSLKNKLMTAASAATLASCATKAPQETQQIVTLRDGQKALITESHAPQTGASASSIRPLTKEGAQKALSDAKDATVEVGESFNPLLTPWGTQPDVANGGVGHIIPTAVIGAKPAAPGCTIPQPQVPPTPPTPVLGPPPGPFPTSSIDKGAAQPGVAPDKAQGLA